MEQRVFVYYMVIRIVNLEQCDKIIANCRLLFFSLRPNRHALHEHLLREGSAVWVTSPAAVATRKVAEPHFVVQDHVRAAAMAARLETTTHRRARRKLAVTNNILLTPCPGRIAWC